MSSKAQRIVVNHLKCFPAHVDNRMARESQDCDLVIKSVAFCSASRHTAADWARESHDRGLVIKSKVAQDKHCFQIVFNLC